jgi:hypothetical protein
VVHPRYADTTKQGSTVKVGGDLEEHYNSTALSIKVKPPPTRVSESNSQQAIIGDKMNRTSPTRFFEASSITNHEKSYNLSSTSPL